jgi:hypothetical protein
MSVENLEKFVVRTDEIAAFDALLRQSGGARMLVIQAQSGAGKSTLLRQLHRHCRTHTRRIPVALLDLKDHCEAGPLGFVRALYRDLSRRLDFPTYAALEAQQQAAAGRRDRISDPRDFDGPDLLRRGERPLRVRVREALARCSPTEIKIVCFDSELVYDDLTGSGVTDKVLEIVLHFARRGELDRLATQVAEMRPDLAGLLDEGHPTPDVVTPERLIDTFFDDLRGHAEAQPVVLLVDSFEQAYQPTAQWLEEWFKGYVFERHFLSTQPGPRNLVLVLAGTRLPQFRDWWPAEDCERVITPRHLAPLDAPLFGECLRQKVDGITDEVIEELWQFYVKRNAPLVNIILFAQSFASPAGRRL